MNLISRWWQSNGFGIESKTDFAFLHDVIREKTPYYAYDDLATRFPTASSADTAKAQLMLRLANYIQPESILTHGNMPDIMVAAIHYGCVRTEIKQHESIYASLTSLSIHATLNSGVLTELIAKRRDDGNQCSAIVLTDINNGNATLWNDIVKAQTITYDMCDIGIALIRPHRYPEHYKILPCK